MLNGYYAQEISDILWKLGFKTDITGLWYNKPLPFVDIQDEIPLSKGYVVISTEGWEDYYYGDKLLKLLEDFSIEPNDSHPLRTLYAKIKPAMITS